MRPAICAVAAVMLAALLGGCRTNADYMVPERLDHGLVFCLDGVGGYNVGPQWLREGLDAGGVPCAIYVFDWGHGPAGLFLADLLDEAGNQRRAAEMARLVKNYRKNYPGRPVYLIGHSGGAGMVVFALEAMAPDVMVDAALLLAPALDPGRNLAPALRHVRNGCYTTHSAADFPLMGIATSAFGTMDRKHTVSAGLVGFRLPENLSEADRREYAKLRQAKWELELLAKGHAGGHMGWSSSWFARQYLAPILRGDEVPAIFKSVLEESDEDQVARTTPAAEQGGQTGCPRQQEW
jgi:pimeloyl-ACP methyl ester carboxylesterase